MKSNNHNVKISFKGEHIGDELRLNTQVLSLSLPNLHLLDGFHPKLMKQQTHSISEALQKLKSCAIHGDCHNKTSQSFDENIEPKYEYLSLALPSSPIHQIQIFGSSDVVDARFLMRSELVLSILRNLSTPTVGAGSETLQERLDALLVEASALLCDFRYKPKLSRKQ